MPPHTDPDALLADYLAAELPLLGVARRHNLTLAQLLDHLDHPDTRAALARLKQAHEARAAHIAADAKPTAISALANIAAAADAAESRRAATALLRAISSPLLPPGEKVSAKRTDEGRNISSPAPAVELTTNARRKGPSPLLPPGEKVSAQRTDEGRNISSPAPAGEVSSNARRRGSPPTPHSPLPTPHSPLPIAHCPFPLPKGAKRNSFTRRRFPFDNVQTESILSARLDDGQHAGPKFGSAAGGVRRTKPTAPIARRPRKTRGPTMAGKPSKPSSSTSKPMTKPGKPSGKPKRSAR